jgi:hypothetical protein
MREIRQSGSEGGGASLRSPYPYRQRPKGFFISLLVLLCYVVSLTIRSNFVPQKGQSPLHLTSQGWIVWRIRSHVAPKVFFTA